MEALDQRCSTREFAETKLPEQTLSNVYLFCASEGLGTVVRGWVNKETLHEKLQLKPAQKIILAQTVGFPKK